MSNATDFDCVESSHCIVCEQELGILGGMAGTGMCGPCCTGEAETTDEFGDTW